MPTLNHSIIELPVQLRVDYYVTKPFPAIREGGRDISPAEPSQVEIECVYIYSLRHWARIVPDEATLRHIETELQNMQPRSDDNI